jgi:hypothetical protein
VKFRERFVIIFHLEAKEEEEEGGGEKKTPFHVELGIMQRAG